MNIAYIGNYVSDAVNGVSVVGYAQARALVQAGHNVFFYHSDNESSFDIDENGIKRRGFKQRRFYQLPSGFPEFIKENPDRIDVFHLHSVFYPINALVARLLVKANLKYVLTPHGGYDRHVFKRGILKKVLYYQLFEKQILHQADAVFCVAEKEKEDLVRLGYRGVMGVAHNPIDNLLELATTSTSSQQGKVMVYLGRYDAYHKGLDRLLYLFKHIEGADSSVILKLYGNGNDKIFLEKLAKKLGLQNVQINDAIYGKEKYKALSGATLYIQASRYEAGGTSMTEAALLGTPVVASSGCYLAPFFTDKGIGTTISDDNKVAAKQILELLNDEERLRQMRHKAREVILSEFNSRKYAESATKLYSQVIR